MSESVYTSAECCHTHAYTYMVVTHKEHVSQTKCMLGMEEACYVNEWKLGEKKVWGEGGEDVHPKNGKGVSCFKRNYLEPSAEPFSADASQERTVHCPKPQKRHVHNSPMKTPTPPLQTVPKVQEGRKGWVGYGGGGGGGKERRKRTAG